MTENPFSFIGHSDALREIKDAFKSGRMPHAWLIAGIEGVGKYPFAKCVADYVLSGGEPSDPGFDIHASKLAAAETHPDLLIIRRPMDERSGELKDSIPVDDALKVSVFLRKTATHGGWRVVVLDEAHTLTRNGQNAILKIIEEPPPRSLVLVTVTSSGALLPTIRSRSRLLQLLPLSEDEMRQVLKRETPPSDHAKLDKAIALAEGSAGFAMKIMRTDALPLYEEMMGILGGLPELDMARLHKLADQIAKKADAASFDVVSALLVGHLREVAVQSAQKGSADNADLAIRMWESTSNSLADVKRSSLDRKLVFVNTVLSIKEMSGS